MMMDIINLNWVHTSPNKSKNIISIHFNETLMSNGVEWMVPSCYPTHIELIKPISQGGSSTKQKKWKIDIIK